MPEFAVIIPVYNRASTVLPTLKSVQDQTLGDFECIVVDDGSSDGDQLKALVESFKDPRFRYVWRPNGGASAARNTGIDEAVGDFVAFLDSDDLWLPEKLHTQASQLRQWPDRVAYCQCLVDRGVGKYWIRPTRSMSPDCNVGDYLFIKNEFIPTPTIALATSIARNIRWDEGLSKSEDPDFCLRLRAAGHLFDFMPKPLVIWSDSTEEGRASREGDSSVPLAFLERHRHMLSPQAVRGFRATVLAYDLAKERPLLALKDLALGAISGVPLRVIARQLLRAFLPRQVYRKMVNAFVAAVGR